MVNLEQKMRDAFGDKFINMILEWGQLTKQDVVELYKLGITQVFAVYDSWEDVARIKLSHTDNPDYVTKHIMPYIDMVAFANHIKEIEKENGNWIELESGKLVVIN